MVHPRDRRGLIWPMIALLVLVLCPSALASPSPAQPPPVEIRGGMNGNSDGSYVGGLGRLELANLATRALGSATLASDFAGPWLKFATTSPCGNARPGQPASDNFCNKSHRYVRS